ncbi:type IV secretory system conjugative DNA transfer family protein [Rhizobium calliandrae]|uniref:Type IV secretory system conjugative DNA transfer family protein n=1 Tax=Rhizobium calliandrae TaxID=1312182 RepID=A0ABT7KAE0_9HYPH|nr:type IV secretory system conjugative DNA transfer family protein [Rhizobium calliandrae]MDL2405584.1 type IV secretory system conjugative DNA transfer family protein [Rhizobium calliandrae]
MTAVDLLKAVVKAPIYAVVCGVLGLVLAAVLVLGNAVVQALTDIEPTGVHRAVDIVAKYLPAIMAIGGFIAAFVPITDLRAAVFGTARWANRKELQSLAKVESGLLIGRDSKDGKLLRYDGPGHLLTMAPTRTGKGVGTIIPNLLTADRSVICIDPKGENARIASRARQSFGPVHILDPFGVTGKQSASFNPLDMLDPSSLDVAEDASTLADALVFDEPGMAGETHWNEEAKALIAGIILYAVTHDPPHERSLVRLRHHLTLAPEAFDVLLKQMQASIEVNGLVARAANRHLGKSDREAAGVLSAAQRHTHFLDSPRMAAVLGRSDFRFTDLKHHNATVFLVLPPDRLSTYSRWLRLLVSQSLTDMARDPMKPIAPVLYLLDEFAALGHLEPVERAMGLMAGYGVQLWPILQDVHQLRATYGKRAGTFLSNASVLQLFGVNDIETAELVGKTIGRTDARYFTASWSEGKSSTAEHISARDLMNPDEVMRLASDQMILLRQGRRPALVRKLRYYNDPEFKGLFDPS